MIQPDYCKKKNTILNKINKIKKIIFDNETINIINKQINEYSYLELVKLNINNINTTDENHIIINNIRDRTFHGMPYNNCLISFNDIHMMFIVKDLTNNIKLNLKDLKYLKFIQNSVILGYLYKLNLASNINFNSLEQLIPITRTIVEMVINYKN
jgi:hypothetical protein